MCIYHYIYGKPHNMSPRTVRFAFLGTLLSLLVPSCFTAQAKKPVLKNTQWICFHNVLVLDAGVMKETYTLDFISARECIYTYKWVMPSHPATYVNPDGSIDTIPGSSSETTARGTWKLRGNRLTIKTEDGHTQVYEYKDGKLVDPVPSTDQLVFEKQ